MYCKKCGIILHPEESINAGMCEHCFDKHLEGSDVIQKKPNPKNFLPFLGIKIKI